jgi:hypothetical protein
MPVVNLKPDTLNEQNRRFEQRPLQRPLFLNSVPKSGSHLLRNIVRMFVPLDQHYDRQFIQLPILQQHLAAFDPAANRLSWGHLVFSDAAAIELSGVRQAVLVRDPYDWVLARARFFISDEFSGTTEHLKSGNLGVPELLNLMIFGMPQKSPSLLEIFTHNAVAWMGTGAHFIRYEDLIAHLKTLESRAAADYFAALFEALGLGELPDDWRERIWIGSDRGQSGTARENLGGIEVAIPRFLPDMQQRLVDYAAPGLRAMLGYA